MSTTSNLSSDQAAKTTEVLARLGVPSPLEGVAFGNQWQTGLGESLIVTSPIDGRTIAELKCATVDDVETAATRAAEAFRRWRMVPAPVRGHLVRAIGEELRKHKQDLAYLVTVECGKIPGVAGRSPGNDRHL